MTKQRVITASILIPLVLFALFAIPLNGFIAITTIIFLYAGWEWTQLMELNSHKWRVAYLVILFSVGLILLLAKISDPLFIMLIAIFWVLLSTVWVVHYPHRREVWSKSWMVGLLGIQLLVPCWFGLIHLRTSHGLWVLCVLLLVWIADSVAYFAGRRYGKTLLIPHVSPKKTRAGFWAAVIGSVIFGLITTPIAGLDLWQWPLWILLIVLCTLASIEGDLFESMLKREAGIKDSGGIIPGHGGLLDRIDSLLAATPFFVTGLILLGKFN